MRWGKEIPQRPALWIAGEGEDDLPGMIEAVAKHHGLEWEKLPIRIIFEAVNFTSRSETDKLIKKLEGMPPMLIVVEALADIMAAGEKDEDKSKDITLVYKNIRRVEKKTGSVFLITHHEGWKGDHERGSTAIRANSDILVRIVREGFKPDKGYIKFTHKKRRGGPKLKEFAYEVKLVGVDRCEHPVPVVTGRRYGASGAEVKSSPKQEDGLEFMLETLRIVLGNRATSAEWRRKVQELKTDGNGELVMGWADTSFHEKLKVLKEEGRVVGGGGEGEYYSVQPGKGREELQSNHSAPDSLSKESGVVRSGLEDSGPLRNHSENENRSGSSQGRTEAPDSPQTGASVPSGGDLVAKAMAHAKPSAAVKAAADRAQARADDATKPKMG
jgi:hypothetical protein